jgi:hypothetical protein
MDQNIDHHELLKRLAAGGGSCTIADPKPPERAAWRRAISVVLTNPELAPPGTKLKHSGRDSGDMVIRLQSVDDESATTPNPTIPVPQRLTRPHPLVSATKAATENAKSHDGPWRDTMRVAEVFHIRVSHQQLGRSHRILQAVVGAAEDRGHRVGLVSTSDCKLGAGLTINGHGFELALVEEHTSKKGVPPRRKNFMGGTYQPADEWVRTPTGRLAMHCAHGNAYISTLLAADRERWSLEDKLGRVLEKLESKADKREIAAVQARREAAQRERERQSAVAFAEAALRQQQRIDHLQAQLDARRKAVEIREWVSSVRQRSCTSEEDEWLLWATEYADTVDPIQQLVSGPTDLPVRPGELDPYLLRRHSQRR